MISIEHRAAPIESSITWSRVGSDANGIFLEVFKWDEKKLNVLYLKMQIFAANKCQIHEQQNNKK